MPHRISRLQYSSAFLQSRSTSNKKLNTTNQLHKSHITHILLKMLRSIILSLPFFLYCISPCASSTIISNWSISNNSFLAPSPLSIKPTPASSSTEVTDINSSSMKSEIFLSILDNSGYDKKLRPPGINNGTGPTAIAVSLYIRSIENIDDVRMEYSVQLTFRQEWLDPRLNYSHLVERHTKIPYLQLVLPERIWLPDIFFSNEKKGDLHKLITPNLFTRVYPNGTVLQSYRITMLLSCPMDLRFYPLDVQSCPIRMGSYGWTTQDLVLKWKDDSEAVKMALDFNMPRYISTKANKLQNNALINNLIRHAGSA